MNEAEKKLRLAVQRRARAWVEVYKQEPDSSLLVKSLLLGIENGIRRRTGTLPEHERHGPPEAIRRAFVTGQKLAEEIPASLIAPFQSRGRASAA